METFKLRNNISEPMCRTCLKLNKTYFNIFEHVQNDKLVVTMLMDCVPLRVHEDDGFPVNICNNCLDKLCYTCDFKKMVMQSDTKLHDFYRNKILESEKNLQNNISSVYIKEEETAFKSEHIDLPFYLTETMNYDDLTQGNLTEEQNISISNVEQSASVFALSMQQYKQSAILVNNNDISDTTTISNYCKNEYIDQAQHVNVKNTIEEHVSATSSKQENFQTSNPMIDENDMLNEDEATNPLNSSHDSDHSSPCSYSSDDSKCEVEIPEENSKAPKKKRKIEKESQVYYNKQAELLSNPDYKRIISGGLSRKEKDRATVFCKKCDKTFKFRYFVSVHAYSHTGDLSFKCEKCDKRFAKDYILKQHMRVHSDTKDFPSVMCELCGKSFLSSGGLARHKETHNTEKNFVCTICGKSFKYKTNLKVHVKRHSDDKRYPCKCCDKRFKDHEVLKKHVLIHTGEKPYPCSVCDKKFRQQPSLRYHMRTHTGETPYDCEFCASKFRYKHHLLNHMKVHRNEILQKQNL